jgi:molybdenum cofactor guanylyltransferase
MRIAGAVLAGGRSQRMGRTKALIEVDGRLMGDRVIDALRKVGAEPVVIYGGDEAELRPLSANLVADEYPNTGPVGGVLGALHYFGDTADAVFVVACDLAMLTAPTLQQLVDAALSIDRGADDPAHVRTDVWVATTGKIEPMCALWSTNAVTHLEAQFTAGERALHRVIDGCISFEVPVKRQDLVNINTPSDIPTRQPR